MNARALYHASLMDRAREPKHAAIPEPATATARVNNPLCGDRIDVGVRVVDGVIEDVGAVARGCALCVASGSLMGERTIGTRVEAARALAGELDAALEPDGKDGDELGSLAILGGVRGFPSRKRCAMLPWEALLEVLEVLE